MRVIYAPFYAAGLVVRYGDLLSQHVDDCLDTVQAILLDLLAPTDLSELVCGVSFDTLQSSS